MNENQPLPDLGANGFGDTTAIVTEQVRLCRQWIGQNVQERLRINRRLSSYGLKHEVEIDCGTFISNGAFIKAALELGFRVQVDGPNACFNMARSR